MRIKAWDHTMRDQWKLILQGLAIAVWGAMTCMLFFVGLSALFVGRFSLAILCLAMSAVMAIGFHHFIDQYLDILDRRERSETMNFGSTVEDKTTIVKSAETKAT